MADVPNTTKILALQKIFFEETDEANKFSVAQLIEKLQSALSTNDAIDKKRIKRYIDSLNESGFEIIQEEQKYGKMVYSHQSRLFETYELRILVDAILSASFVTESQANNIIDKLGKLTSSNLAKTLPSPIKYNKSMDHIYHLTKVYIDKLHHAIQEKKVITFKYGRYTIDRTFELNRNGQEYVYHPYALIWDQGYYYLIGQKENKDGLSNYRIDRMRDVEVTEKRYRSKEYNIDEYLHLNFHMFHGTGVWVEIEFRNKYLINPIIDKFGLDADIRKVDENTFILKTKAIVGEGFYNWLRGWGSSARLLSPPELVQEMKEEVEKMNKLYS
ncbi:WYL domain-containing protein [Neobacillus mesonae]|uniref:helix-turn-helix transcriptional regulator n=1 Tax=Neobacillus mesonae TaxID=1193713 RepID=UPI00203D41B0|nr:WYL domain-containing protein [Neobacillus mesonae]MCM3570313.1 WYL domain-containing protein [Neobacillus mesonae]